MTENKTKVNIDLSGLEAIRKQLGEGYYTKVGVVGAAKNVRNSEGVTNAELGLIHEFGSETNNIPPRSFLRMPLEIKAKDIVAFLDSNTVKRFIAEGKIEKAFKALGVVAEGYIMQAFSTGGYGKWAPNQEDTAKRKGSSKPLIDTGQLRQSITSQVVKNKK